jgi:hypothetical protein
MLEKLSQSNIKVPVVVRSHYVAVDEHGRKITSSTGTGDWIHKDSAAKTIYSLGATGTVIYISRAAKESNVVSITDINLNVKSRGSKLFLICEDLNNDTNSQDTSDQQEASDKQKPITTTGTLIFD